VKNQRRAFIFITYESEEIVEQVIATPKQTVGGREVSELSSFQCFHRCSLVLSLTVLLCAFFRHEIGSLPVNVLAGPRF
jgi:hypothetical protein